MSTGRESPRRREVLEVLRAAAAPLGVTDLAERMRVHPNTVRFHLDALVSEGLVQRRTEEPSGRGRPRTVYAAEPGMHRGGTREYRLLAQVLLSQLASTGPEAHRAAAEAGRAWGAFLVDPAPPLRQPTAGQAADGLVALLDDLGFAPTAEHDGGAEAPQRIRLRHCPFLELAEEYGQLVCPLHLGLMQGALAGLRAPLDAVRLEPFATPDSCVAHLRPAPA
ncbi:helix-turn-helix transcriptional regulator [Streptomyces sp. H51]|uniref:helix-turn-helix transcriptional regulator n=1 Tax=Streptomyces sp. H51 TaxID=3111770 RepID=UPI002D781BB9|nr:helix-turn-helix domain-containing protein [Streptomyces sp. H51]